jgi:hypothetical protein
MNLVIHELLTMPVGENWHIIYNKLLIGGSNQSHKVNFKELSANRAFRRNLPRFSARPPFLEGKGSNRDRGETRRQAFF